jgi:hypothetical protein
MFVVQRRTPVSSVRRAAVVGLHVVHEPEKECCGCQTGQWWVGGVSFAFLWVTGALGNGSSGDLAFFLAVAIALKNSH